MSQGYHQSGVELSGPVHSSAELNRAGQGRVWQYREEQRRTENITAGQSTTKQSRVEHSRGEQVEPLNNLNVRTSKHEGITTTNCHFESVSGVI